MPSTYSNSLRIELIAAGEQAGTWNITTNRNLGTLIEQGIAGVGEINISAGSKELLALNGAADEARNAVLILTGTPVSGVTLTVPNADKQYTVQNRTTQPVTFKTAGAASGYTCPPKSTSNVVINAVGAGETTGISITDDMAAMLSESDMSEALDLIGGAPLASPVFTGVPQGPTAAKGASTKQLATTEFVQQNGVPSGTIVMWHGSVASIPTGWRLCNGQNGTPNLVDRFVVGAAGRWAPGNSGGSANAVVVIHNHATEVSFSGQHSHGGGTHGAGAHAHNMWTGQFGGSIHSMASDENSRGNQSTVYETSAVGDHAHGISLDGNHSHAVNIHNAGESGTDKNLPPFYALCFIMKV